MCCDLLLGRDSLTKLVAVLFCGLARTLIHQEVSVLVRAWSSGDLYHICSSIKYLYEFGTGIMQQRQEEKGRK